MYFKHVDNLKINKFITRFTLTSVYLLIIITLYSFIYLTRSSLFFSLNLNVE